MSWKHDTWWFAVSFAFVCGISLGGFICSLWDQPPPQTEYHEVLPSPAVYWEGKRSEPGVLSPETLHAIELQTAREMFSGKMRDPFARKAKKGRDRQQVCLEEEGLGR